jgi:hypothetical protein
MHSHGGRARAIESGDLHIDVAFVAAPTADTYGNLNGVDGKSACGTLGYLMVDVKYADRVVAITDNLVPYPACPIDITQDDVDYMVQVESIGDPQQPACPLTSQGFDKLNRTDFVIELGEISSFGRLLLAGAGNRRRACVFAKTLSCDRSRVITALTQYLPRRRFASRAPISRLLNVLSSPGMVDARAKMAGITGPLVPWQMRFVALEDESRVLFHARSRAAPSSRG